MDAKIPVVGGAAPDFTLPDLDGKLYTLSHQRGRVVILNFWSAECPWSARIDVEVLKLANELQDVQWWSVAANDNESPGLLSQAAKERGVQRVLHDAGHKVADLYGAQTTPHFFVVDEQGFLTYQGAFSDLTFRKREAEHPYLQDALEALRRKQKPPVEQTAPYGCSIVRLD